MFAALFHEDVKAKPFEWNVIPSACIVNRPGDFCRLEFEVLATSEVKKAPPIEACLYLEDDEIECWNNLPDRIKTSVEIKESSTLLLVTKDKKVLLEQTLEVKSVHPVKKRRRVRSPWSMF